MNAAEIEKAEALLADRVVGTERIGLDGGGLALTVHFQDGSQKRFDALDSLEGWLADRDREPTNL